ncbi:MAG: O-antigen ligase family protein [Patescibacteria group bacterium]|nr:O-antigen ligase family protein [Patescibacteria group bacterium]
MVKITPQKIDSALEITSYITFFATPLTFVFITHELFEFPKMILIYFFSVLLLYFYFLKPGRGIGQKVPYGLPFLGLLLATFISYVFSQNRYTSLFGYYSRFNGGLLSLLAFAAVYLVLSQKLTYRRAKNIIGAVFFSGFVVSIYAILQNFGIDKNFWVQDSQARAFSTLGQPNWLAAYLLAILPIPVYFYLTTPSKQLFRKIFFLVSTSVYYFGFWSTFSLSGFLGLLTFIFLFLFKKRRLAAEKSRDLAILSVLCLLISVARPGIFGAKVKSLMQIMEPHLTFNYPVFAAAQNTSTGPSAPTTSSIDTGDIRLDVWRGALNLWESNPKVFILGTGPETFAYAFLPFRPASLNFTTEWDFLYNKAHNYYLDILSGTGLLGFFAYCWFSFSVIKRQWSTDTKTLNLADLLFYGWFTILVTNFFGWPTVSLSLIFFSFPLFMIHLKQHGEEKWQDENNTASPKAVKTLVLTAVLIFVFFKIANLFLADVSYSRGLSLSQAGDYTGAANSLISAVNLNYFEPAYHRDFSLTLAQKSLLETGQTQIDDLNAAVGEAETAYNLNPQNSLTLKTLVRTYFIISQLAPQYTEKVYELLQAVIKLSPTQPQSYYDAALIDFYLNKKTEALNLTQKALSLKPNYTEAKDLLNKLEKKD